MTLADAKTRTLLVLVSTILLELSEDIFAVARKLGECGMSRGKLGGGHSAEQYVVDSAYKRRHLSDRGLSLRREANQNTATIFGPCFLLEKSSTMESPDFGCHMRRRQVNVLRELLHSYAAFPLTICDTDQDGELGAG